MEQKLHGHITSNNTVVRIDDECIVVKLYNTDVVRYSPLEQTVVLNAGEHRTKTTKERMNEVAQAFNLPFCVYQSGDEWFVNVQKSSQDKPEIIPFENGMVLDYE